MVAAHNATQIWDEFKAIATEYDYRGTDAFEQYEKDGFFNFISHGYAVMQIGQLALYYIKLMQFGKA